MVWRGIGLALVPLAALARAVSSNTIGVDMSAVVTELPEAMNGGGCGIEFIEHEIMGGFYSQLVVGESFEEPHNASTGISTQWAIGGGEAAAFGTTHRLISGGTPGSQALNGVSFLQMTLPAATIAADVDTQPMVWVQNRGLNFQGLTFHRGLPLEGWLWMSTLAAASTAHVAVQLRCGSNTTFSSTVPLAEQNFTVSSTGWSIFNVTALTPTTGCVGDGSIVIVLRGAIPAAAAALNVDMVFVQPGAKQRYKNLPVKKDLAEYLLSTGMSGMRMGGGTINTWICTMNDTNPVNDGPVQGLQGSGYVLSNFRGPRWKRQPMCGQEYPHTSAGWGWVDFANFCEAANITAAITLNERDDPVQVVEYLFGPSTTPGGKLRIEDGHPQPYDKTQMLLEIGNERMPGHSAACAGNDCIAAFFGFALKAQARADELKLGKLPLVLAIWAWGLFDPANPDQKALVQRAATAGLDIVWDQHVGGMSANAPYSHPGHASYAWGFHEMGNVTASWQAQANGSAGRTNDGVRTVVFEENGEPGWQAGLNIHNLARGLGHAQNVLSFQRVPGPHGGSQVVFVGQADCLQAYHQNHAPGCDPATDKRHCNSWDQGTVFFDNKGNVWGQPTYYSARMLTETHQPLVINVTVDYNASSPSQPSAPALPVSLYIAESSSSGIGGSIGVGGGVGGSSSESQSSLWLRHCYMDLFGTPIPSKFWHGDSKTDNSDSSFYVHQCAADTVAAATANKHNSNAGAPPRLPHRFWLSPLVQPEGSVAPLQTQTAAGATPRLHAVSTPGNCKTGLHIWELEPATSGSGGGGVRLKSLSPGYEGTYMTLIDDGCTTPSHPGGCNFSKAGDTCRAAVLAPKADAGNNAQQVWHSASANSRAGGSTIIPAPYAAPVALDAHASRSHDGKELSVRVVNPTNGTIYAGVAIQHGTVSFSAVTAQLLTSASRMDDNNPPFSSTHVSPRTIAVSLLPSGKGTEQVTFPPHSFITMQFK